MTLLQGPLADRSRWSPVGECPVEKTMSVVGTKSAMLIMREAYYGTTRFDDFARRVGITKAATSARLAELVDLGLLTRRPYREPGQRIDLLGALIAQHLDEGRIDFNHAAIGGLKVTTENGWFAARPSGTEDVYKIYAESFKGSDHLKQIQTEAQALVNAAIA